jgi:hypothetical protein
MNPISLLFKLFRLFIQIDEKEFAKTLEEANEWYSSIRFDDDVPKEKRDFKFWFKKYSEMWYMKLAYLALFMYLRVALHRWISSVNNNEDDE